MVMISSLKSILLTSFIPLHSRLLPTNPASLRNRGSAPLKQRQTARLLRAPRWAGAVLKKSKFTFAIYQKSHDAQAMPFAHLHNVHGSVGLAPPPSSPSTSSFPGRSSSTSPPGFVEATSTIVFDMPAV
ncbi:hypothetical protein GSI_02651 [Ganoderma sinense ZZ0214-1]|uniref:Uncharacterized protein n=1 Tax=Ganoderma sinense ZZ0214-1 TaxID=1077348 RepID=A0A2G8SM66_9APHY|nr:hypothetical protein GSI_02651 [Ganoderma sinense ZZ0214-1]